jgi:hypothetical protein
VESGEVRRRICGWTVNKFLGGRFWFSVTRPAGPGGETHRGGADDLPDNKTGGERKAGHLGQSGGLNSLSKMRGPSTLYYEFLECVLGSLTAWDA